MTTCKGSAKTLITVHYHYIHREEVEICACRIQFNKDLFLRLIKLLPLFVVARSHSDGVYSGGMDIHSRKSNRSL